VLIKLIAPNKLENPNKCNPNIATSTLGLLVPIKLDNGGYKVHPVPAPFSINVEIKINMNPEKNNQKLILFNLGYAISNVPINMGTK
jgi:hypothetical protein